MSIRDEIHDRVWDAYYGILGEKFQRSTRDRVHWICHSVTGQNVLDIGCSSGIVPILLAREGIKCTGIDIDPKAIEEALEHLSNEPAKVRDQLEFIEADFINYEGLESKYDTVILSEVLEHLVRPEEFVIKAANCLKENGKIIVTVPFGINDYIDHKRTYYLAEPCLLLSRYFHVTDIQPIGRWIGITGLKAQDKNHEGFDEWLNIHEVNKLEKAFYALERELVDESRKRLNTAKKLTKRVKLQEEEINVLTEELSKKNQQLAKANQEFNQAVTESQKIKKEIENSLIEHENETKTLKEQLDLVVKDRDRRGDFGNKLIREIDKLSKQKSVAEKRQNAIREHLSYQLGHLFVTSARSPVKLVLLPWNFIITILQFRRNLKKKLEIANKQSQDLSHLPIKYIASQKTSYFELDCKDKRSFELFVRLQSFSEESDKAIILKLKFIDGSNNFIMPPDLDGFKPMSGTRGVFFAILQSNLDTRYQLAIPLPENCESICFALNKYHAEKDVLVTIEKYLVSSDRYVRKISLEANSLGKAAETTLDEKFDNRKNNTLKILTLLDQFSEDCFRPEAIIIPLSRKDWESQIIKEQPDIFLAESAWRGNAETWNYCMTKFDSSHGDDLRSVLALCRDKKIPTVFWNKEDPANFDVFINVAKEFDYIFTTDVNCIQKYKAQLGHDRVFLLPFAAQTAMHNPEKHGELEKKIAFAGSWNGKKYPLRAQRLKMILEPALRKGMLDIFDRYADSDKVELRFPDRYAKAIKKSVPYRDVSDEIYRRYMGILNVNSVEESESMVARRVYEVAACGTPIISTPSKALEGEFAEIVNTVNNEDETDLVITGLLAGDLKYLARATTGVRLVHSKHTYTHRLDKIADIVGLDRHSRPHQEPVTIMCVSKRPEYLDRIASMIKMQTYPQVKVIFVIHNDKFTDESVYKAFEGALPIKVLRLADEDKFLADGLNLALNNVDTNLVAKFDDDDYYGPNYLLDQVLALNYTNAGLVGKASFFCFTENNEYFGLRFPNRHYRYVRRVHGGTLVWDRRITGEIAFTRIRQGTDSAFLNDLNNLGIRIFSTDPFNFVHVRYKDLNQHTWKIQENEFINNVEVLDSKINLDIAYV